MDRSDFWYVLHIRLGAAQRVCDGLTRFCAERSLKERAYPFIPQCEMFGRGARGRLSDKTVRRPLFFGYVFVKTDMPASEFLAAFGEYIYSSHDVLNILSDGEGNMALPDGERDVLKALLGEGDCVLRSEGALFEGKAAVSLGPLAGNENRIAHISKLGRSANIRISLFGRLIDARVALKITDGASGSEPNKRRRLAASEKR